MSTILKALQRLEDEKTADVERSLEEQIVERRSRPGPDRRRGLSIGLAAIGGVALAAAVFLLWPSREESDAVVAMESPPLVAAPAPAQPAAAEKPRRQPAARTAPAAPEQAAPAEVEIAAVVEVVERLDAQPADSGDPAASQNRVAPNAEPKRSERRPGAHKPKTQRANEAAAPRSAKERVTSAESPALEKATPPAIEEAKPLAVQDAKPSAIEKTRPAAIQKAETPVNPAAGSSPAATAATTPTAPVEIAAVAPEPAPLVGSDPIPAPIRQPQQKIIQRAKVPALSIEKTIWHPDTSRRIAFVKLIGTDEVLRLKEGDAIGPLVVESIKPGSVLFNHDGIEISFNVGS